MASWILVTVLLLIYSIICRYLRFQRQRQIHTRYVSYYPTRLSLAQMTNDHASEILLTLAELEFPQIFHLSLSFALFKTFGIPSISQLLVRTKELMSPKRSADTAVLMSEMVLNPPTSLRSITAIARVNHLHRAYRQRGDISESDMLYTLAMFALEPLRWIQDLEWRQLTDIEICAIGVFWKSIGDAMDVSYDPLLQPTEGTDSACKDPTGVFPRDGIEWIAALDRWSQQYERKHMQPAKSNAILAHAQLDRKIKKAPRVLQGLIQDLIATMLGDRLRAAFQLSRPSQQLVSLMARAIALRRFILKYLILPRPTILRRKWLEDKPDPTTGRYHFLKKSSEPYYQKPSLTSRLKAKLLGENDPRKNLDKYHRHGYKIHEVGPAAFDGRSSEYTDLDVEKLINSDRGGCPFPPL